MGDALNECKYNLSEDNVRQADLETACRFSLKHGTLRMHNIEMIRGHSPSAVVSRLPSCLCDLFPHIALHAAKLFSSVHTLLIASCVLDAVSRVIAACRYDYEHLSGHQTSTTVYVCKSIDCRPENSIR